VILIGTPGEWTGLNSERFVIVHESRYVLDGDDVTPDIC